MLTQEYVRQLLDYDQIEGTLRWRVSKSGHNGVGSLAGAIQKGRSSTPLSYIRVTINGHRYMAHTIIWCWMTGEWLPREIDHKDTNGANNKWDNLRKATRAQNTANSNLRIDNALGIKGVHKTKHPSRQKRPFVAQINFGGKNRFLGRFATAEEAHGVYAAAAVKAFGEFARTK